MDEKLISLIDEIIKYGINSNLNSKKSINKLEQSLTEIYLFYLSNDFLCDDEEYTEFKKENYFFVEENVNINFPSFGNYKLFQNTKDLGNIEYIVVNAKNDLIEIIFDLLEVNYTFENYGSCAGQNLFDFIFGLNTKQKIINLLSYINSLK